MPRTTVTVEIELEVEYEVYPAERDVGVMAPYVGDMTFYSPVTGKMVSVTDILTDAQQERIADDCMSEYEDSYDED